MSARIVSSHKFASQICLCTTNNLKMIIGKRSRCIRLITKSLHRGSHPNHHPRDPRHFVPKRSRHLYDSPVVGALGILPPLRKHPPPHDSPFPLLENFSTSGGAAPVWILRSGASVRSLCTAHPENNPGHAGCRGTDTRAFPHDRSFPRRKKGKLSS